MEQTKTNKERFQVDNVCRRTQEVQGYNPTLDIEKYICTTVMVVPIKDIIGYIINEPCLIMRLDNRALKIDGSFGPCLNSVEHSLRYATKSEILLFFNILNGDKAVETLTKDLPIL
jgi:hypothetical protein